MSSLGARHAQIPVPASISLPAGALTAVARWSVLRTLGACAILGVLTQILLVR